MAYRAIDLGQLLCGAWLVRQILDPIIELRQAIDRCGGHEIFAGTRPVLDENNVDFRVRQPPPLRRLPRHRFPVRYIRKGGNVDTIEYLLELQDTLDGDGVLQHRCDSQIRRAIERSSVLPSSASICFCDVPRHSGRVCRTCRILRAPPSCGGRHRRLSRRNPAVSLADWTCRWDAAGDRRCRWRHSQRRVAERSDQQIAAIAYAAERISCRQSQTFSPKFARHRCRDAVRIYELPEVPIRLRPAGQLPVL